MGISGFSVSGGADSYLNASEIADGYVFSYTLDDPANLGTNVLILINDTSGHLLYWYTAHRRYDSDNSRRSPRFLPRTDPDSGFSGHGRH